MQAIRKADIARADNVFDARISAWVDGHEAIRPEDLSTPYGRQVWDTYHLIGDVLRSDSLAIQPSSLFYARLSKAIDAEPTVVVPVRWSRLRTALSGAAAAAVVAGVAWIAESNFLQDPVNDIPVLARLDDANAFSDYLQAHRDITGIGTMLHASAFRGNQP